jgi:hypothetical protein
MIAAATLHNGAYAVPTDAFCVSRGNNDSQGVTGIPRFLLLSYRRTMVSD